ncbi:MAG: hypothetical protein ACYTA5_04460 [Planctomycetota bacterium]|jgi:hypothetical protein
MSITKIAWDRLSLFLAVSLIGSAVVSGYAQSLPLFFKSTYGDVRDTIASQPRKFKFDDPAWHPKITSKGEPAGETSAIVHFDEAAKSFPIRFGIPLGQIASCDNVAVFDETGNQVASDIFPLVNFNTCRQHWVMIATVLDATAAGDRRLTIKWGPDIRRSLSTRKLICKEANGSLVVRGGQVGFILSPEKLLSDIRVAGSDTVFAPNGSLAGFQPQGQGFKKHRGGRIVKLFDGLLYKRLRTESSIMNDNFKIHFEVETWANSPYLFVSSRVINESDTVYKLSNLTPLMLCSSVGKYSIRAGGEENSILSAQKEIVVAQRVDDWCILGDGRELAKGAQDAPGEYIQFISGSHTLTLIVPDFQGFGPGDPDLESRLWASSNGELGLLHYTSYPPDAGGSITFWDTMARTFRMVLHVGSTPESPASIAAPVRAQPMVRYDRQFLTVQSVFNEDRVTHVYDEPSLEGARYFSRTRACRHDYPIYLPPHPQTSNRGKIWTN